MPNPQNKKGEVSPLRSPPLPLYGTKPCAAWFCGYTRSVQTYRRPHYGNECGGVSRGGKRSKLPKQLPQRGFALPRAEELAQSEVPPLILRITLIMPGKTSVNRCN
jgi:hypothetical protein